MFHKFGLTSSGNTVSQIILPPRTFYPETQPDTELGCREEAEKAEGHCFLGSTESFCHMRLRGPCLPFVCLRTYLSALLCCEQLVVLETKGREQRGNIVKGVW